MSVLLQAIVNGVAIGAVYGLIAMGFSLQFATTKVFNAAYGCNYLVAAYIYVATTGWIDGPTGVVVGCLLAALGSSGFSVASAVLVYDRMRSRSRGFYAVFLTSFGLLIIVQNVIAIPFGSATRLVGVALLNGPSIGGVTISYCAMLAVAGAVIVTISLWILFFRSTIGMQLRAQADDQDLVAVINLPLRRNRLLVFAVSGLVCTPAAILGTYLQGVKPADGLVVLTVAVVAAIVGGVGSIFGAAICALLFGLIENVAVWQLPGSLATPIAFGVFFAILLIKPGGFTRRAWA